MGKAIRPDCWEFKACGHGPRGETGSTGPICPAAMPSCFDGTNGGTRSGRFCWAISGTLCDGAVQGSYAEKLESCLKCDFYLLVERQEGRRLRLSPR